MRMTATEAARTFSDVLSRVASGEVVEVTCSGTPVAVIGRRRGPASSRQKGFERSSRAPRFPTTRSLATCDPHARASDRPDEPCALLIATDLLVDLERADAASPLLLGAEDRAISVITVSELLHGVHRAQGAVRARLRAFVEHLLAGLEAIPITEPVARVHAYIWADLAGRGQQIGARDLWISATALAHGLGIASRVSAGTSERDPRSRATSNLAGVARDSANSPVAGRRTTAQRRSASSTAAKSPRAAQRCLC